MQAAQNQLRWRTPFVVFGVLLLQILTHLAWLPISTQAGQIAVPWLMSRGMTMFGNMFENRPPATGIILAALFRLLPQIQPLLLVRALNLLLILALTLLVYALAKRLTGSVRTALLAVVLWALWEPVYGNILFYFDTLVGLLLVLAAILGMGTKRTSAIALCGVLLGLATLFKQPAWAAAFLFGLWLVAQRRWRDLAALIGGALVFPLLTVLIIALQGNLSSYLFWNFGRYLVNSPGGQPLTGSILRKFLFTDMLAPAFILRALKQRAEQRQRWLLVGALWLGGIANLLPNFSEIYLMAHLPLLAVMSGVVISELLPDDWRTWFKRADTVQITLVGVALAIAVGWAWIIITPYIPGPLGRARIPAYDEFIPVAERVNAIKQPGDSLYVIPILDGNPQLFEMTDLLPPGSWIMGNNVFMAVPGMRERLLAEWALDPPDIVVDFPDLRPVAGEWIEPLADFVKAHYTLVDQVDDVPFNGDAVIYRVNSGS
ncbi:MAG: DUF2079 domain-containing protein [Chloroflexota bacterium]